MSIIYRILKNKYCPYAAAALSGIILALAYRFTFLWWLCLVALVPLCMVFFAKELSYKKIIRISLCFCLCYYFPTLLWLFEIAPIIQSSVGVTASYIIMGFAIVAISLLMGLLYSLPMMLIKRLRRNSLLDIITFSALFASGELLTALLGVLSFPWGRIANIAVACLPMVQIASVGGGLIVGFIITVINGLIAKALLLLWQKDKSGAVIHTATACMVLCANLLYGSIAMLCAPSAGDVNIMLVQGNFPNNEKLTASTITMLDTHLELTRKGATDKTDLVIWSETAIPTDIDRYDNLSRDIKAVAKEKNVTIVVGYIKDTKDGTFNVMRLYYPDGTLSADFYAKQLLVPMGEFTPFSELFGTVFPDDLGNLASRNLTHGNKTVVFDTEFGSLNGMICYESILPSLQLDATRKGSQLICMITNDSWFGTSNALDQHLAQAQLRAVENGRFLARSANSGITALITPSGVIKSTMDSYTRGYVSGAVSFIDAPTVYSIVGDLPFFLLLAYCIITFILDIIKQKRQRKCKISTTRLAK